VVFTSTRPGSTRDAIAEGSEGPPAADETEPDDPGPNGKEPEPNGSVPEPNGNVPDGNVPEPNGKLGEPDEGEFADGCEVDVERDCQAIRPMPNPAATPTTSNPTTSKTVGT
jgi:hypothetical protein